MKTQNTNKTLDFNKNAVTELSNTDMHLVEGGSGFAIGFAVGRIISKIIQ